LFRVLELALTRGHENSKLIREVVEALEAPDGKATVVLDTTEEAIVAVPADVVPSTYVHVTAGFHTICVARPNASDSSVPDGTATVLAPADARYSWIATFSVESVHPVTKALWPSALLQASVLTMWLIVMSHLVFESPSVTPLSV